MWIKYKVSCLGCKHELSTANFNRHADACKGSGPIWLYSRSRIKNRGSLTCVFCNREFENGRQIGGHITWCKLNPEYENTKAKFATKRKPLPKDVKEKISRSQTEYFENNPDEIPYRKYHHKKGRSYPEKLFAKALEAHNITGWIQEYRHSVYTYDFAFPDLKLDVEIDGSTHQSEKVKRIDAKRDVFATSNGWQVLRIEAKDVNNNVEAQVQKLKEVLKGFIHV